MKDYLFSSKLSDSDKRKRALKELDDLSMISEEARARMKLSKYQKIRTRERKINKFINNQDKTIINMIIDGGSN